MGALSRLARCGLILVVLVATMMACSSPGDLAIYNEGPDDVTVLIGDEEVTVPVGGGVVLLGSGCSDGDVTVEFDSGQTVVLSGPVCPEEQIMIRDGKVELQPAEE